MLHIFCNYLNLVDFYFSTTISALSAFLEAFQKVADLVANTRGNHVLP